MDQGSIDNVVEEHLVIMGKSYITGFVLGTAAEIIKNYLDLSPNFDIIFTYGTLYPIMAAALFISETKILKLNKNQFYLKSTESAIMAAAGILIGILHKF